MFIGCQVFQNQIADHLLANVTDEGEPFAVIQTICNETLNRAGCRANHTAVPEIKIAPALCQQLLVGAHLHNAAIVKNKN